MTRVAVVVHERLGKWAAQLRPRLRDRPVRWYETRSRADLVGVLAGLATPVVVIDLARREMEGLADLAEAVRLCPGAFALVLNPEEDDAVERLARELGATHVISGFAVPPEVAALVDRWIGLAARAAERGEWTRPLVPDAPSSADEWIQAAGA
jgi:hypothetical protein